MSKSTDKNFINKCYKKIEEAENLYELRAVCNKLYREGGYDSYDMINRLAYSARIRIFDKAGEAIREKWKNKEL